MPLTYDAIPKCKTHLFSLFKISFSDIYMNIKLYKLLTELKMLQLKESTLHI